MTTKVGSKIYLRVPSVRSTGKGAPSRPGPDRTEMYDIELLRRLQDAGLVIHTELRPHLTPREVA